MNTSFSVSPIPVFWSLPLITLPFSLISSLYCLVNSLTLSVINMFLSLWASIIAANPSIVYSSKLFFTLLLNPSISSSESIKSLSTLLNLPLLFVSTWLSAFINPGLLSASATNSNSSACHLSFSIVSPLIKLCISSFLLIASLYNSFTLLTAGWFGLFSMNFTEPACISSWVSTWLPLTFSTVSIILSSAFNLFSETNLSRLSSFR